MLSRHRSTLKWGKKAGSYYVINQQSFIVCAFYVSGPVLDTGVK